MKTIFKLTALCFLIHDNIAFDCAVQSVSVGRKLLTCQVKSVCREFSVAFCCFIVNGCIYAGGCLCYVQCNFREAAGAGIVVYTPTINSIVFGASSNLD